MSEKKREEEGVKQKGRRLPPSERRVRGTGPGEEAYPSLSEAIHQIVLERSAPLSALHLTPEDVIQDIALKCLPLALEEMPAGVEQAIDAAVRECVKAVCEAHEQIESNRGEIEALGEETRRLLSELKAA